MGAFVGLAAAWWLWHRHQKDKRNRRGYYEAWQNYEPGENVHGLVKFADGDILRMAGAFEDRGGLPLGYFDNKQVYHNDNTSVVTLGQSGIGKGSQILIPALLLNKKRSFVIPDIDGEQFNVTAEQRAKFSRCLVIDPYQMFSHVLRKIPRGRYNPMGLHWLRPGHPLFWPRCMKLASAVVSKGHGRDEYWYLGGRQLAADLMMTLRLYARDDRVNLTRVAQLVQGDPFHFARWAIRSLVDDEYLKSRLRRWSNPAAMDIRSLPEVVENTKTQLSPWLDPAVAETTSDSTFSFSQCAEEVTTVYYLAPHDLLDAGGVARPFTTLSTCALGELIRFNPKRRIHTTVMLDEFYELPLDGMDHMLVSARKAKTSLWICLQDLAELKHLYPDTWSSFMNSAGCIQFLGASDLDGSTFVSNMLGQTEVKTQTKTSSYSARHAYLHDPPTWEELEKLSLTRNESQAARPLMLPQEIRSLGKSAAGHDQQILFLRGVPAPVLCDRKSYLDVPSLRAIAGRNPFYVTAADDDRRLRRSNDDWMKLLA